MVCYPVVGFILRQKTEAFASPVCNFTRSQLDEARSATDRSLVVDQVLYHPYNDQAELLEYCREHDIVLTAYSPLARGGVVGDEVLTRIGDRYEKSAVQVALRWLLQQEQVIAIPKATSRDHIESNFDVFDFTLTESEMHTIDELDPGLTRRVMNIAPALMRHNPL